MLDLGRRDFITLLGGAAAWPLAARAQSGERTRWIGALLPGALADAEYQTRMNAFVGALAQLGWTVGRNLNIDTRWATTNRAEIRRQAAELASSAPDVVLSSKVWRVRVAMRRAS